jgi:hypothetical protein
MTAPSRTRLSLRVMGDLKRILYARARALMDVPDYDKN